MEMCECGCHGESLENTIIGSDSKLHCYRCNKLIPGWDSVTVESLDDEQEEPK